LPGFPTAGSPYGFFFADLDGISGVDTLYVADDTTTGIPGGIAKYSLVAGAWISNGAAGVAADSYRGLTGKVSGSTVTLFATRKGGSGASGGGELVTLVDSTGYNGGLIGSPFLLVTAAANTAFRGVALAPEGRYRNTAGHHDSSIRQDDQFRPVCDTSVIASGTARLSFQWLHRQQRRHDDADQWSNRCDVHDASTVGHNELLVCA
jgi:hypothetical protein